MPVVVDCWTGSRKGLGRCLELKAVRALFVLAVFVGEVEEEEERG